MLAQTNSNSLKERSELLEIPNVVGIPVLTKPYIFLVKHCQFHGWHIVRSCENFFAKYCPKPKTSSSLSEEISTSKEYNLLRQVDAPAANVLFWSKPCYSKIILLCYSKIITLFQNHNLYNPVIPKSYCFVLRERWKPGIHYLKTRFPH